MQVAGEKTQALVLSQWARDATDCSLRVAGKIVSAGDHLKLLGVTIDRLLHFGPHCRNLRQRVRPRTAQLRRLTGRDWGLEERQLRTIANGYVRGAIEHAAAAWLPATSPAHATLLEREMRAAARVITGCPISTPSHAVMAEAGLAPVAERRLVLAARLLAKAHALPEGDPLRAVASSDPPTRLSTTGWRQVGGEVLAAIGVAPPVEPMLPPREPPWVLTGPVYFHLDVGAALPPAASAQQRLTTATLHLASLPQCATWCWTDGSASGGITDGGAGAFIERPDGEVTKLRIAAGRLCSSYRAEMIALQAAADYLTDNPAHEEDPIIFCTDSMAALARLREGPTAQTTPLGIQIWRALCSLASSGRAIHLQWVPSHCGIPGNERADTLAGEASALDQNSATPSTTTIQRAAARLARARTIAAWPDGWYRQLQGPRLPPPIPGGDRSSAVDVHQLRAGHWSRSSQYLHRIGKKPTNDCAGCENKRCPAARCELCREEADTPAHVLMRCPALMNSRFRVFGSIHPTHEDLRSNDEVATLGAAFVSLQSRLATP
ncbi:uncharacterized protein LOC122373221 [Amphibalanus amphitrite]|uniref:uncharacterized protein LOC122373221 n=1 Tax=Amphibalanus amphitrite TaxID=1232801 RepID=UPI001C9157C0|nr:uncharacterized protein LOC122373221 [Amphibalanus amphitrite]